MAPHRSVFFSGGIGRQNQTDQSEKKSKQTGKWKRTKNNCLNLQKCPIGKAYVSCDARFPPEINSCFPKKRSPNSFGGDSFSVARPACSVGLWSRNDEIDIDGSAELNLLPLPFNCSPNKTSDQVTLMLIQWTSEPLTRAAGVWKLVIWLPPWACRLGSYNISVSQ